MPRTRNGTVARATHQPGRAMSPERYQALLDKLGIVQQTAGVRFGHTARAGQHWKATGPPPTLAMLLNVMDKLNIDMDELEGLMRDAERASRIPD